MKPDAIIPSLRFTAKRALCILLAVLGVAALTGFVWQALRPDEPVYKGMSLSAWMKSCSHNWPEDLPAREAVRAMGTNTIPYVHSRLHYRENPPLLKVKLWLNAFGKKHTVAKVHWKTAEEKYREAGRVYNYAEPSIRGQLMVDWVQLLEEQAVDPVIAWQSQPSELIDVRRLGEREALGSGAFMPLMKALSCTNDHVRSFAVANLRYIPSQREAIVPALLQGLHDKYDGVRGNAALSLAYLQREGYLGQQSETVATALLNLINDRDVFSRRSTTVALGFFTNQASAIVPALLKASENSADYYVRPAAMEALRQIAPEAAAKAGVR